MAKVRVGLGFTMNLGDFQSARVDIAVEDDAREGEGVNDAFERIYAFVENKLVVKQEELEKELSG
jgi:hypothetical protein